MLLWDPQHQGDHPEGNELGELHDVDLGLAFERGERLVDEALDRGAQGLEPARGEGGRYGPAHACVVLLSEAEQ